jgi:hypothetical protein
MASSRVSLRPVDSNFNNNLKKAMQVKVDFYFEKHFHDFSKKNLYLLNNPIKNLSNKEYEIKGLMSYIDHSFEESISNALLDLKENNNDVDGIQKLKNKIIKHVQKVKLDKSSDGYYYVLMGNKDSIWNILSNYFYENEKMSCAFRLLVALEFSENSELKLNSSANFSNKIFDLNDCGNMEYVSILEKIVDRSLKQIFDGYFKE